MKLLVVYDCDNMDARVAAGVLLSQLGPGRGCRAGLPLPDLSDFSVVFVGEPSALTLAVAMQEACAVAVVATHTADILPRGVLWTWGPTLTEAARRATGS